MTVFVDTSALYSLVDRVDADHNAARSAWESLRERREPMRSHSYVVLEASALIQRRLGMDAIRDLHHDLLAAVSVRFVDSALHDRAVTALLAGNRRSVSLVDWTSFEMMRDERIGEAFAFDDDFATYGFTVQP